MEQFTGLIGIVVLLAIAFALSNNRKKINLRIVGWGLGLQMVFAIFILKLPFGGTLFGYLDKAVRKLISFSDAGSDFLFKSFIPDVGYHVAMINFAFRALPAIIFFSSLMAVLYHYGIIQVVVKWIARAMQKTMGTSGSETLSASANIFVGQTEAPLMVRPFISKMTQSELTAVMTGGFATVAGGILAIYVMWLGDIPGIAGHLLAASVMSAPAALVMAKIIYPETEISETMGDIKFDIEQQKTNVMEALGDGASTGLKLAANVGAMLIAFVSLVAMINYLLSFVGISMDGVLGFIFKPLAWTMGVSWEEAGTLGMLMGEKIVFTELIAYGHLKELMASDAISDRTAIIASYALCGFANFGSMGIQLGGLGGMAPDRKTDLAKLVTKAMIGGALASWLTATIAGLLI
jgi:CNT family concentrative nucleoside transporter